ncbi:MAG: DM13 domain-containing protein [Actinomycetota bacterium]
MNIPQIVRSNKLAFGAGSVVFLAFLAWLAFGYFGIQAAFIDDVVDEAGPVFDAAPADTTTTTTEPADEATADADEATTDGATAETDAGATDDAVVDDAAGDDVAAEEAPEATEPAEEAAAEPAAGEVVTIASGDFSSLNSYSVSGDALVLNNGTEQRFLRFENFDSDNGPDLKVYLRAENGDFISLGDLSGNIGNQNYEIPVDVDLSVYDTVQIWCERFSRGFGEATLSGS